MLAQPACAHPCVVGCPVDLVELHVPEACVKCFMVAHHNNKRHRDKLSFISAALLSLDIPLQSLFP
jgi:hypothetical protein